MKLAPKAPPAGREEGLVETDLSDSGARSSCSEERLFFTTPPRRDFTETISIFDQSWIREQLFSIYQNWMHQRIGQRRSDSFLETWNGFKTSQKHEEKKMNKEKTSSIGKLKVLCEKAFTENCLTSHSLPARLLARSLERFFLNLLPFENRPLGFHKFTVSHKRALFVIGKNIENSNSHSFRHQTSKPKGSR